MRIKGWDAYRGDYKSFFDQYEGPIVIEWRDLVIAAGPTFAHAMTKKMMHQEWNMGVDEAIEAEAQAQAICMATQDFHRAYNAFAAKQKPLFKGD